MIIVLMVIKNKILKNHCQNLQKWYCIFFTRACLGLDSIAIVTISYFSLMWLLLICLIIPHLYIPNCNKETFFSWPLAWSSISSFLKIFLSFHCPDTFFSSPCLSYFPSPQDFQFPLISHFRPSFHVWKFFWFSIETPDLKASQF